MLGSNLTCVIGNGWTFAGTSWRVNWIGASNGGTSGAGPRRGWLVFGFGTPAGGGWGTCCGRSAGGAVRATAKLRRARVFFLCLLIFWCFLDWPHRVPTVLERGARKKVKIRF